MYDFLNIFFPAISPQVYPFTPQYSQYESDDACTTPHVSSFDVAQRKAARSVAVAADAGALRRRVRGREPAAGAGEATMSSNAAWEETREGVAAKVGPWGENVPSF